MQIRARKKGMIIRRARKEVRRIRMLLRWWRNIIIPTLMKNKKCIFDN